METEAPMEADAPQSGAAGSTGPGRNVRAVVVTLAISVLAFFTGLSIFNFVVMPRWVHQGDETLVPDVRRLDVRQAEGVLDQAGLRLSIRGEQFDPEVPKGAVITQSPRPNDAVRRGRVITVFVSLGEEYASVPALHGESIRHARILLSRAGLEVGDVVRSHSEWLSQGLVLASDPPAQAVVPRGTPVHLVESQGPASEAYLMPDVRGLDARSMAQNLEALGFRVRVEGSIGGFATIFEQVPMPGVRVESSDEIILRVAGRVIP
jgi:beta-lactam-binding protein with PASTA domain